MNITLKTIVDDISNLLTKFGKTDESRINDVWLAYKINQVRSQLIMKRYDETESIDYSWLSDLGLVSFHSVNFADDPSVDYCCCDISKAFIPQTINLPTKTANVDLGIYAVISSCGKTKFYNRQLTQWRYIPADHEYNKFSYYSRINTAMYVNKKVDSLRIVALLANPEDGYYKRSAPIASGSLVNGTSYIVKGGQVIYNATVYQDGDTFTAGATTTYTGDGKVYLASQAIAYRETDPYPVSPDMARDIVLEICTKEFGIEKGQIADIRNDSKDDAQKG